MMSQQQSRIRMPQYPTSKLQLLKVMCHWPTTPAPFASSIPKINFTMVHFSKDVPRSYASVFVVIADHIPVDTPGSKKEYVPHALRVLRHGATTT